MESNHQKVKEFHEKFGHPAPSRPALPEPALATLRFDLIHEEFNEIIEAYYSGDLVEFADGVADLLYVVYGLGIVAGLPVDRLFAEVHASNMSKLGRDGKPILRQDGKILKGEDYWPPNIEKILSA